jgi:hypothetical protein
MTQIFSISSFKSDDAMHGGTLRSMQIRETLNLQIPEIVEIEFDYSLEFNLRFFSSVGSFKPKLFSSGVTIPGVIKYATLCNQVRKKVSRGSIVFIEICGANSILLGLALQSIGCRLICFPHNVESMVQGVKTRMFRDVFSWLRFEMELYKNASQIYCISTLDAAILGCYGVSASSFPYFPSESRMKWLMEIQVARRRGASGAGALLFSSVNNPPTRIAVDAFIKEYANSCSLDLPLTVAGRGTEVLSNHECESIRVLGEVTEEEALALQKNAEVAIVPARQTTGFLTKLIENNLIGLRTLVFGNYLQAEGLEDYGVITVVDQRGLLEQISKSNKSNFLFFTQPDMNFKKCI